MINEKYFRGVTIRKTYTSNKDSTYKEILDGIDMLGQNRNFTPIKSPLEINCKNGNKMLFRGLDNMTNIKSLKGINYIWVEEAEDLTEREFDDLKLILRGDGYNRIMLTFNPMDEAHFSNARFTDVKKDRILETFDDGEPKVWEIDISEKIDDELVEYTVLVVKSTYDDNYFIPAVQKLEIERLKTTNPELYEIYRKGNYGIKGGKIFDNYEEVDFTEKGWIFDNFDKKGYVQDFGFNHANCILRMATHDNNLYIFQEQYEHERTTAEIEARANAEGLNKRVRMICDSAEPDKVKTWRNEYGYNATGVKKYQGSVKAQIDFAKKWNKIYIDSSCVNTLKEIKGYMWKMNKQGKYTDEPNDFEDDAMACIRYSKDLFDTNVGGWGIGM